jgi:hypothetical protein
MPGRVAVSTRAERLKKVLAEPLPAGADRAELASWMDNQADRLEALAAEDPDEMARAARWARNLRANARRVPPNGGGGS